MEKRSGVLSVVAALLVVGLVLGVVAWMNNGSAGGGKVDRETETLPGDGTVSFTIDETACKADQGMTFYEWANSNYPAQSGLDVSCESLTGYVKILNPTRYLYPSDSTTMVKGSDTITSGGSYRWIGG